MKLRAYLTGFVVVLGAVALGSCGGTDDTIVGQLNLDRPVDLSFACWGGLRITNGQPATPAQDVLLQAQPTTACDIRSTVMIDPADPTGKNKIQVLPPGQEDLTKQGGSAVPPAQWYTFILQSATGTVAIAHFGTKPAYQFDGADVVVDDADILTPGSNAISVGEDPIAIVTSRDGCKEITANAGSCDLSVLDVASAVDGNVDTPIVVDRLDVKTASGAVMRARPAAMLSEPNGGTIGATCGPTANGLVYVAYPGCHLVAGIDSSTGTIVTGIQFAADGSASIVDGNVSCPDECGGGGTVTAGIRPVTLALEDDTRVGTRRMVIGADNSNIITVVELDLATTHPQSVMPIVLEQNRTADLGVSFVAISRQIGMGGSNASSSQTINDEGTSGGQAQYVYAVATDGTVRVADILTLDQECDTQVDSRFVRAVRSVKAVSCFPVGAPTTPPRRSTAKGPGIYFPAVSRPLSIAIVQAQWIPVSTAQTTQAPGILWGYYAMISTSNGATYIANVDDDNYPDLFSTSDVMTTSPPLVIAHQLRDGVQQRSLTITVDPDTHLPACDEPGPDPDASGGNAGPTRAPARPTPTIPSGYVGAPKHTGLPYLHASTCVGSDETKPVTDVQFAAPTATRDVLFPDLRAEAVDETWTFTYEGALSQDSSGSAIDGPRIREGQMFSDDAGLRLADPAGPFCAAGVEPWDIVELDGCNPTYGNVDCPVGYVCYVHPESKVANLGACMLTDEASRLADVCKDFLTSLRNYTVARADSGSLVLLPRKHVLRTTPLDGCTDDTQCHDLAHYDRQLATDTLTLIPDDPVHEPKWACEKDTARAPLAGTGKRCIQKCSVTDDCTLGTVCEYGYCMEGVTPPQACINAPQRYSLLAHEAFVAIGTTTGYIHPIIADPTTGQCVRNPAASPWQIGRFGLTAPACDPTADPITGLNPGGVLEPNPCSLTVTQSELVPDYIDVTQSCATTTTLVKTAERSASAIKFRDPGMTLTFTDPTYPGDERCVLDRGGSLQNVPIVFPTYQISFRLTAGFTPYLLNPGGAPASYPVKVVRGPTESIWIVDEGDYLSTSVAIPSTRGKVYRIESGGLGTVNILQ